MKVLIFTKPGDYHSYAVKWGLEQLGHQVTYFFASQIPQKYVVSFEARANDASRMEISSISESIDLSTFDVVWYRRMAKAIPDSNCHPADIATALRDWTSVFRSMQIYSASPSTFAVNDPDPSWNTCKITQLDIAHRVGFKIPATLVSNDPAKIRDFVSQTDVGRFIVKPIVQASWISKEFVEFALPTTIITHADLDDVDLITCPAIYQSYVEKNFEIRCVVMGGTVYSIKMDSQAQEESKIDFRNVKNWSDFNHELIDTPADILEKVQKYMDELRLVFGAFDFICDLDGNWIFLEVNTMGNFLWMELYNPDIPLLETFVKLLISKDKKFILQQCVSDISLDRFKSEVDAQSILAKELEDNPGINKDHYVFE